MEWQSYSTTIAVRRPGTITVDLSRGGDYALADYRRQSRRSLATLMEDIGKLYRLEMERMALEWSQVWQANEAEFNRFWHKAEGE